MPSWRTPGSSENEPFPILQSGAQPSTPRAIAGQITIHALPDLRSGGEKSRDENNAQPEP